MGDDRLGERIAALSASFEAEKEYQHDRWHKLDNDLTPVVNLPEKLTREIGRLHGLFDEKLNAVSREFERSLEGAIERALKPVVDDMAGIKDRVQALETSKSQLTGAKMLGIWLIQTILSAVVAVIALGRGHQ